MNIRAVSSDEAQTFLRIPCVWQCQTDDELPQSFAIPEGVGMFGGLFGSVLAGLALTHPYRDGAKLHYYVLPAYRAWMARDFLTRLLSAYITTRPLYVAIPVTHRKIINFAKHGGFEYLETERAAWRKGDVAHDREILIRCHS